MKPSKATGLAHRIRLKNMESAKEHKCPKCKAVWREYRKLARAVKLWADSKEKVNR